MRCKACNVELTDSEATNKDSLGYIDMCRYCLSMGTDTTPMEVEYVKETSPRLGNDYDT